MKLQSTTPSPWVLQHAGLAPQGEPVLDLACGFGRHTRFFLEKGFAVTAIDIDVSGLRDVTNTDLTLIEADLENAPWPLGDQTFGTIVITNYLHRPLFPHIIESLDPGGLLIYETFAVGNEKYGRPSNPDFLLEAGELKNVFSEDFEIISYEMVEDVSSIKQRVAARKN